MDITDYALYDGSDASLIDSTPPEWLVQASLDAGDTGSIRVSCYVDDDGVVTYRLGDGDGSETWTRTVYADA